MQEYLLRGLTTDRPNHCWAADITYIPMRGGFVYLVAIVDWATRTVLAHQVSIAMSTDVCVEVLEEAIATYGRQGPLDRQRLCRADMEER